MASTYTTDLRIEKIATGEQSGTWGTTTNTQYDLWEDAIAGTSAITHDDTANYTLSANNGSADQSRNMFLNIGGTLTAARNAVVPTFSKLYFVRNSTSGGFAVTVKTSAGTGISVAAGDYMVLYCDGTNVVDAFDTANLSNAQITGGDITGITDLAVADGGTGASTAGGALTNLGAAASGANSDITSLTGLTTPLSIAQGGTAAITASAARTALGVAIGSDVQAYDADNAVTDAAQTFTVSQRGTITTDNDLSFDQDVTNNFQCTPSGTGALTFTNHTAGQSGNILLINTGGHAISLAATTKGDANLATTISAAGTYWLSYYDDGTNAYVVTSAVFA